MRRPTGSGAQLHEEQRNSSALSRLLNKIVMRLWQGALEWGYASPVVGNDCEAIRTAADERRTKAGPGAVSAGFQERDCGAYGGTFMPIENISRRTLLGSATAAVCLAALSKAGARPTEWKPRLGILGRYTEANVDFAIQEEFNNMILSAGAGVPGLDTTKITDEEIARVKNHLSSKGMHVSALQVNGNHIAP